MLGTSDAFKIAISQTISTILNQIVEHKLFENCVFKNCDLKTQKICFFKSQVRVFFFKTQNFKD
jgi:hypothetical protein